MGKEIEPVQPEKDDPALVLQPSSQTAEQFAKAHPTPTATVQITLAPGQNVTCAVVDDGVWLMRPTATTLKGVASAGARAMFLYAGGGWISDNAKAGRFFSLEADLQAKDFISKPANENKAVEFRLSSADQMASWHEGPLGCLHFQVVLEETSSENKTSDSAPMTLFDLIVLLEKRGIFDATVSCHSCERPASVQRGDESDRRSSCALGSLLKLAQDRCHPSVLQRLQAKSDGCEECQRDQCGWSHRREGLGQLEVCDPGVASPGLFLIVLVHEACATIPGTRSWALRSLCGTFQGISP